MQILSKNNIKEKILQAAVFFYINGDISVNSPDKMR